MRTTAKRILHKLGRRAHKPGLMMELLLRVLHQLLRDWQALCVEALNLVDAGAGILRQGVDVYLPCDSTSRMQIAVWRKL